MWPYKPQDAKAWSQSGNRTAGASVSLRAPSGSRHLQVVSVGLDVGLRTCHSFFPASGSKAPRDLGRQVRKSKMFDDSSMCAVMCDALYYGKNLTCFAYCTTLLLDKSPAVTAMARAIASASTAEPPNLAVPPRRNMSQPISMWT